ncbi:hypothetical protein Tco_1444872 [Tanacetum coccineum]
MSSPSAPTIPETITPTGRAQDNPLISPFHDDPYMLVRQAYTPIAMDTESEPFEDPIKTKETQPLSLRATPLSPDYILASLDYTPGTPHSDEESEPMEAPETRNSSPLDSTSPLSPDHLLTQTSPTPTHPRAFFYRSTARMAMCTQPTLSPGISARVTDAMTVSPFSFYKRYWGTSEPILDTETEGDESKAEGTISESGESEDEGPGSESEKAAFEGQQ